jgi:hypothetical protein
LKILQEEDEELDRIKKLIRIAKLLVLKNEWLAKK